MQYYEHKADPASAVFSRLALLKAALQSYTRYQVAYEIDINLLLILLWPPCVAGADVIFPSCGFFFYIYSCISAFSSLYSQPSHIGCLFHTWCGLSANLGCRYETCCTRLAEIRNCHAHCPAPFRPRLPCSYLAKSRPQRCCLYL